MFVSVFKTTVHNNADKLSVIKALRKLGVQLFATLDLQDEDRILRVESNKPIADRVVLLLNSQQYDCEELGTFRYGVPV